MGISQSKNKDLEDLDGQKNASPPQKNLRGRVDRAFFHIRDEVISEIILTNPNLSTREVAQLTGYHYDIVLAISKKLALRKAVKDRNNEIKREVLEDKIPILKEITSLSLTMVRDYLQEIKSNPIIKENRLKTVNDLKVLTNIAKELNEMLRLELGQTTSFDKKEIQLSIDQTNAIFVELEKTDPVFDYPKLNNGRKEALTIEVAPDKAPCRDDDEDLFLYEPEGGKASSGSGTSS